MGNIQGLSNEKTGSVPDIPLLDRNAFYAPLSIIVLANNKQIIDFNLAAKNLFGSCINSYRSQAISRLLETICEQLPEHLFVNIESNYENQTESISIVLPAYGKGRLRCWLACFSYPETGAPWYSILYSEVVMLRDMEHFSSELANQWRQHLTWEAYAISYDKILLRMDYYQEVLSRHYTALSDPQIHQVIDLGAGTGNLAAILLNDSQSHVTAVDLSRAMLERLRSKLAQYLGDRLMVLEQSAESLSQLESDSFDGASILLAMFDMNKPLLTLQEAIRLLRPGGVLVVTEPKKCFRIEPILDHVQYSLKEAGVFDELESDFIRVKNINKDIDPHSRTSHSPLRAEDIYLYLQNEQFESLTITDSHFGNCATVCAIKTW